MNERGEDDSWKFNLGRVAQPRLFPNRDCPPVVNYLVSNSDEIEEIEAEMARVLEERRKSDTETSKALLLCLGSYACVNCHPTFCPKRIEIGENGTRKVYCTDVDVLARHTRRNPPRDTQEPGLDRKGRPDKHQRHGQYGH